MSAPWMPDQKQAAFVVSAHWLTSRSIDKRQPPARD